MRCEQDQNMLQTICHKETKLYKIHVGRDGLGCDFAVQAQDLDLNPQKPC